MPLPLIQRHFPEIPPDRLALLEQLAALTRETNARINVISRKDIAELETRHLLHSLAAHRHFKPAHGARVADIGTGGGFPGLPLAILNPRATFTLVDSIAKKTRAIADTARRLGLDNVRVLNTRAETLRERHDYVFGRAVTALPRFLDWAAPLLRRGAAGEPDNGVLYFKGTRHAEELAGDRRQPAAVWDLHAEIPEPFFEGKYLLHFPAAALA
ncbi:MAG: 16S rRNA (guanine(527)-N(7))-methyltransferase RsmG [Opitutaceae bacterium]|jgi:16S rRNA (guanine527-N7)-methyltransferase|nr:16S rRNA (guanine(527)-N(7))-methyltransferase RsmG [Opitutaceae bacterium]